MTKKSQPTRDELWQQNSQFTRSQVFASGTVQKWLELADKAFEADNKNNASGHASDVTAAEEDDAPPVLKVRRKSA